MKKRFFPLLFGMVLIAGCTSSQYMPEDCRNYYPELPDNEYCFRKIAEYRDLSNSKVWKKNETVKLTDGRDATAYTPKYSLEGYLGILEGRRAILKRQLALTAEQSSRFFKSQAVVPDFLVEAVGTYSHDPAEYRIISLYYKPENEEQVNAWLEKLVPSAERPRRNVRELCLLKNKECVLLEPLSPSLWEYDWKKRMGDIGKVEGLERRMKGAPEELVKYIAQMRKWSELEMESPGRIGNQKRWAEFLKLVKIHSPFYLVMRKVEKKPFPNGGYLESIEEKHAIVLLDMNANIVWKEGFLSSNTGRSVDMSICSGY